MKFVISKTFLRNNPYLYMSVIFVSWIALIQTKSLNVSNVLERISSGDLNEKDVLDFYKKDYDSSLEYHQFFQPCLAHLIQEEKGKANSFINRLFPGVKNYFTSNYRELEFQDLGIKIKCEVYINKFVSKEYKLQKKFEPNSFKDLFENCKKELSKLEKINENSTSRTNSNIEIREGKTINSFNFKSNEKGPKIEYQDKPLLSSLSLGDDKVEFQDKPENNIIDSLKLKRNRPSDSKSSSSCNEELQKIKARVSRLEKDNALMEKQIVEKNRLFQQKDELNNHNQESNTKLKLEITEKEKSLNLCHNKNIELKADIEKCQVKVGTCGGSNCVECENKLITKIDELTTCEKIKKDFSKKNTDLSEELTDIRIKVSSLDIGKKNVEKKLKECNSDNQNILKKLSKSESQVNKINNKSCAELDECKKSLTEKIHEIKILKMESQKNNPSSPAVAIKKGSCEDENGKLKTELNICNQKQIKFISTIEQKNKIIIKKESDISTLEIEKNNLKTEFDKIEKVCRDDKEAYEKKFSSLEEKFSEEKKKYQICRNELKDNKGYKKKLEKCEENNKKEKTKIKDLFEKQKFEIIKVKSELDKCEKDSKRHQSELKIKITMNETCEKDKDDFINKLKKCSQNVNEEKKKLKEYSNSVTIEKDRLVQEEHKKCKTQIDILNTKIVNYEKEIRLLRMNQDCPLKLTKCNNEKVVIENTLKSKEAEVIRIKEEKDTCENELKLVKENYNKYKTKEAVCKKSLEEATKNWRNCESKKPVPCPAIDQTLILKIRGEYERCNNDLNNYKDDNQKMKEKIENLEKLIKKYEENKNKCVSNCTSDLETCQKNIIQIQNKCDEEIRAKIEEINTLRKRTLNSEEKCNKKMRDIEENNKKCTRHLKQIKTKTDECQKNYSKEVDINKKYVIEISSLKMKLTSCLKRSECMKNAKGNLGPLSEKCEKHKTALMKETFTLKEKITKLEEEKKSIYMSSKHIIGSMWNKCQKDVDSYGTVMEDIESRIKNLYTIKIAIEGEIRSDEILIMNKNKEINVKTEEKNMITTEINKIRNDYDRIFMEIKSIRENIRKSEDVNSIRTLTDSIFNKERELKEKNEIIIKTSLKEKEILNVIVIIQEQINNYSIIKNIRLQKIKENEENIEKLNKILIHIKKTFEIKKTNIQKTEVKIEKFSNIRVMIDARISSLEKEKERISKDLETCNTKLEEEKSTNNLLHMKINKTVTTGLIDVNLLMRIFEDNSFTERNCARLSKFKTKFYAVCPMKSHTDVKRRNKKHKKNTPVESQFPLKAKDLSIESQEKIDSIETLKIQSNSEKDNKTKSNDIESQFQLKNKDLKIESQQPLANGILNHNVISNSSSSNKNSKVESQFPLKNKDLKIESQQPIEDRILDSHTSSSSHAPSNSNANSNNESQFSVKNNIMKIKSQKKLGQEIIESQIPLKSSEKIESQESLDRAKNFRNESEDKNKSEKIKLKNEVNSQEKIKGQAELDLNKSLIKLLDAGKN